MTDERERLLRQLDSIMLNEDEQESRAERVLRIIEANCERVRADCLFAAKNPYGDAANVRIHIRIEEEQGCSKPPP